MQNDQISSPLATMSSIRITILRWRRMLLRTTIMFALISSPICSSAESTSKEPADIKKELEALKAEISNFKKMLETTKGTRSELEQELETNEKSINSTIKKIDDIEHDLNDGKKKIGLYGKQQRDLLVQRDNQQTQLRAQIRASYQMGNQPYLKVLLNQEDPNKLSRMLTYYDYISRARSERIGEYNTTLSELDRVTAQLQLQTTKLNVDKLSLDKERQLLESVQKERLATVKSLNLEITRTGSRLENKVKDQKHLEELLARIADGAFNLPTQGDTVAFSSRKGRLLMPVYGTIKSRYGSRRGDGKLKWDGIVIAANAGDPVHAVHYGRVVFADWLRGFGLLMIISHGEGYMSLYGHNQLLYREAGDWVKAGEVIATVGNTGGQLEPGLYFEIRYAGKPTNPQQWCKVRNRGAA